MFPILKFYFVIFKLFTTFLDSADLCNLSSLSRRARVLIKYSIPKNKYKLKIHFSLLYPKVELIHGDSIITFNMKHGILFSELPDENGLRRLLSFTETFIDEMTSKAEFLSTTFNCDIDYLLIHSDCCGGRIRNIIDWIRSRQPSIDYFILVGSKIKDDDVLYIIQNIRTTRYFGFKINALSHSISPLHPTFNTDSVYISGCLSIPWVSLDDVSTFDCIEINLGGGPLYTVQELNRFLKAWRNGSNERMEYFSVYVPHFNCETMLDGIEVEEVDESVVRFFKTKDSDFQREIEGGFDIRTENGTKLATFWREPKEELHEDVTVFPRRLYKLEMYVWK